MKKIILSLFVGLFLTGCEDFLDSEPRADSFAHFQTLSLQSLLKHSVSEIPDET